MKLTKEQKAECIEKLNLIYHHVKLLCDGRKITLCVERWKGLNYRVCMYIDGQISGKWYSSKEELPEHKFMRKVVRPVHSASEKKKYAKILGVRRAKADPLLQATYTMFHPDWPNGKAAINHLCKVCESVEIFQETKETP